MVKGGILRQVYGQNKDYLRPSFGSPPLCIAGAAYCDERARERQRRLAKNYALVCLQRSFGWPRPPLCAPARRDLFVGRMRKLSLQPALLLCYQRLQSQAQRSAMSFTAAYSWRRAARRARLRCVSLRPPLCVSACAPRAASNHWPAKQTAATQRLLR